MFFLYQNSKDKEFTRLETMKKSERPTSQLLQMLAKYGGVHSTRKRAHRDVCEQKQQRAQSLGKHIHICGCNQKQKRQTQSSLGKRARLEGCRYMQQRRVNFDSERHCQNVFVESAFTESQDKKWKHNRSLEPSIDKVSQSEEYIRQTAYDDKIPSNNVQSVSNPLINYEWASEWNRRQCVEKRYELSLDLLYGDIS